MNTKQVGLVFPPTYAAQIHMGFPMTDDEVLTIDVNGRPMASRAADVLAQLAQWDIPCSRVEAHHARAVGVLVDDVARFVAYAHAVARR